MQNRNLIHVPVSEKYNLPHKILILALSVIIVLSFLETGLFIAGFNPYGGMKAVLENDSRETIIFNFDNIVPDPVLLWKLDSRIPLVNSKGYWAEDFPDEKGKNELRVFCMGDSFTLFTWVKNYPDYLQELLDREILSGKYRYKSARVINGGLAGYSTFQGVVRFRRIPKYNPDIVVFIFGWNDATPANSFPDSVLSSENAFSGKFLSGFRLYNIFRISLLRLTGTGKRFFQGFHWKNMLKRWLLGIHQGRVQHLDYYLDEFTFRFNRRTSKSRGMLFYRLIQQSVVLAPIHSEKLVA